jgi:hypothetical protein
MVSNHSCIQAQVFAVDQVDEFKKSISSLPRDSFFLEKTNGRWGLQKQQPLSHRYENPHDSWFDVLFGKEGEVVEEKITLPFKEHQNVQTIRKVVSIALKWMAEQMLWQGKTKQMSMSMMQHYNLQKGEATSAIPWHRDNSDHTLVILLDDETKWKGGNFLFRIGESEHQSFQPKRGYGLLFSNKGTRHCVEPLVANENGIDRTILTIHEKVIQ